MINDVLIGVLIAICISLVLWGLKKQERIYQFPFLMGGMFFVFIIPQAISLVNNAKFTSTPDTAIQRVLLMSCLCAIASWLGYLIPVPNAWLKDASTSINQDRLKQISAIYVLIGIIFALMIFNLPGEYGRRVTGISTGILTVYVFFLRGFLNIGFPIAVIEAIKKFSLANFILAAIALVVPIYQSFFLGRRSSVAILLLSIALAFYFVRRIFPPRWIVICAIIFALFSTISIKDYRQILITQDWSRLNQINPIENLQTLISDEGSVLELRNAALLIDFVADNGHYGWGTYYWDRLVFFFVPGQFLGTEFKRSLQFNITPGSDELIQTYSYSIPNGSTITGIGEAFIQFDYFGCLLFGASAFFCKWLWYRALLKNNPLDQAIYTNLILGSTVGTLVSGHALFLANIIIIFVFTLPIRFIATEKRNMLLES